jgi:trafficking protein particle complex subunit 10
VETLIRQSTAEVIGHTPSLFSNSEALVSEIVEVLEKNADWVDLYGATGELIVPNLDGDNQSELHEAFSKVKKVSSPI